MFNQTIIDRRLSNLASTIRKSVDPTFQFTEIPIDEVEHRVAELSQIFDAKSMSLTRELTDDEVKFIRHEINHSKADFLYWATRYAMIKSKDMDLIRFKPTAAQELLLKKIATAEYNAIINKTGDGILLMVLKARQLGISTISDCIIGHRSFFYGNTTALIAADVEVRTQNLYEIFGRVLDNTPWWMKPGSADPKRDYRAKNKMIAFADQDSVIRFSASKNMQGGDSGQDKGSLGTGQTLPLVHLSELALWENPWQIDDALMPSIPMSARTFGIFESTAKGRGNWWHEKWEAALKGLGRRIPVFIPWYVDPATYTRPAPVDWVPSQRAENHAERVRVTSPRWVGKTIHLTKNQLYWWESTRAEYVDGRTLHKFLAEYTSDDQESFQASSMGVFPGELIDDLYQAANKSPIYIEIKPKQELLMDSVSNDS